MSTPMFLIKICCVQAICRSKEEEETFAKEESFSSGEESQGKVSMGTSLEAQTGNSVKAPFFRRKRQPANRTTLQNNKAQVLRIKVRKNLLHYKGEFKDIVKNNITCSHNRKTGMIVQWAAPFRNRGFKTESKQWRSGREHLHMHFHSRYTISKHLDFWLNPKRSKEMNLSFLNCETFL